MEVTIKANKITPAEAKDRVVMERVNMASELQQQIPTKIMVLLRRSMVQQPGFTEVTVPQSKPSSPEWPLAMANFPIQVPCSLSEVHLLRCKWTTIVSLECPR